MDGQPTDDRGNPVCGADRGERGPCMKIAGFGTDHLGYGRCKHHYGSTPTLTRKAFQQMAYAMGEPLRINPADAIAATVATTAGHVAWLERKVAGFRFVEATTVNEDGVETVEGMTPNQLHWWKIYQEERDRLVRYCEIAIRSGLAERQIALAEAQGAMMANAIDRILDGLGLTDEQLQRVPDVVPQALRGMIIEQPALEGGD